MGERKEKEIAILMHTHPQVIQKGNSKIYELRLFDHFQRSYVCDSRLKIRNYTHKEDNKRITMLFHVLARVFICFLHLLLSFLLSFMHSIKLVSRRQMAASLLSPDL